MALLRTHLALTVPMCLADLARRGGPTDTDWVAAQAFGQVLAEHGDELQYTGQRGRAAALVATLARTLAVLAYVPGGVTFLGDHWEVPSDASVLSLAHGATP